MKLQDVLDKFAIMSGLTDEETIVWIPICEDAIDEIRSLLKDSSSEESNNRRLTMAAACLSFYRYTTYRASGSGMDDFSAGYIRVSNKSQVCVDNAYKIWADAKASIADIIKDPNFIFERVSIYE